MNKENNPLTIDTMCDIRFTWCCIRKLRMGGFDYKAAQIAFNKKTGLYEPNYKEFKVNYSGSGNLFEFSNSDDSRCEYRVKEEIIEYPEDPTPNGNLELKN